MDGPKDPKKAPLAVILRPPKPPQETSPDTKASAAGGGWRDDVLEDARRAIVEIMRGKVKRLADARLRAAILILNDNFLAQLSDEALLEEVRRRAGMNAVEAETSNEVEAKEEK